MEANLSQIIDRFEKLTVLVVGEAILDSYLDGTAQRLSREAPVPIVTVSDRTDAPGGASNTAANVRSLGGRAIFLSIVGADSEGALLRRALEARDVSTDHLLTDPTRRTLAKNRVMASSHMLVRFDQGDTTPIGRSIEEKFIARLGALFARCDAVIVSDYGYGLFTPAIINRVAALQARAPRIIIADSRRLTAWRPAAPTAVKPNYQEAMQLLGPRALEQAMTRAEAIAQHGDRLLEMTGAQIVAVTVDSEGSIVFERGRAPYRTYAKPVQNSRAAGAGDTFISALALALAAGAHTPAASELASAAAAIVVGEDGTATCDARELREYVSAAGKVADLDRVAARAEFYRRQDRRIVFTNGCFDILHRGHITYLNRAKALGDVLVVGINSDDSVRRLKGPARPINPLDDRLQVLAALSYIDHLVAFDGDTPSDLIRAIRPDVFVKGGDYTRETLPEAPLVEELGGRVELLPFVEDRSTSGIIERIREAYGQSGRRGSRQHAAERPQRAKLVEPRRTRSVR